VKTVPKLRVAGSNPVSRSRFGMAKGPVTPGFFVFWDLGWCALRNLRCEGRNTGAARPPAFPRRGSRAGSLDARAQLRHFGLHEVGGEVAVSLQGYPNVGVAQDPAPGGQGAARLQEETNSDLPGRGQAVSVTAVTRPD